MQENEKRIIRHTEFDRFITTIATDTDFAATNAKIAQEGLETLVSGEVDKCADDWSILANQIVGAETR
jgi:hypothetical protein